MIKENLNNLRVKVDVAGIHQSSTTLVFEKDQSIKWKPVGGRSMKRFDTMLFQSSRIMIYAKFLKLLHLKLCAYFDVAQHGTLRVAS
jgi:hypothetical protein